MKWAESCRWYFNPPAPATVMLFEVELPVVIPYARLIDGGRVEVHCVEPNSDACFKIECDREEFGFKPQLCAGPSPEVVESEG